MCNDIVVLGAGGFGREIMESLYEQNIKTGQYNILGFIDDNTSLKGRKINGFEVIGTSDYLVKSKETISVLVCVGESSIRRKIVKKLESNANIEYPNFICENVNYNKRLTKFGKGNIIYTNTVLTTNVEIGDFNYINSYCSISHDVSLGDFVTISPSCNIAGSVDIGSEAYIGIGTSVREGISIGEKSIIGMGSVVIGDIDKGVVAFGNPCKVQRARMDNERVFK